MGVYYRRSKKIGKNTNVNVSSSSVGLSTGVKGARIGINSKGISSINLSIPGTGFRYRKTFGKNSAGAGAIMICLMGFMNLMVYMVQVCFVAAWWMFKLMVYFLYYMCIGFWIACKFVFRKTVQFTKFIIERINKSKKEKIISNT